MKLFVDDKRAFPKSGYECCRDVETAKFLISMISFDEVSLDYDLGESGTGLDILKYLKARNAKLCRINIHSDNVIGKALMSEYCAEHFPDAEVTFRTA